MDKVVERAKKRFKLAVEKSAKNRKEALDDIRFAKLGEQWPETNKKERELEGRPCLTINKMPAFLRQITNDFRQSKPQIKTSPIDSGGDKDTAEILDGVIKNIQIISKADIAFDTALDQAACSGFGYFRINTAYARDDSFDLDIVIERIHNQFSVYEDTDAIAGDGSDWMWCFVTSKMKRVDFEAEYPGKSNGWTETGEGDEEWIGEDEIRIAEYWEREEVDKEIYKLNDGSVIDGETYLENMETFSSAGLVIVDKRITKSYKVTQYILCGLEEKPLETKEWQGKYIPIVPCYGEEVIVDGEIYYKSAIRDAKDAQRMFNYWRTTTTEQVALAPKAPFVGAVGAFETDKAKWATANVKNHPFIEYDPVTEAAPPQRQPFAGVPAGAMQEALSASDDMKSIIGIHDASLGARSNETSGKAILARQREGDVSTFHFLDNMTRAIRHAGTILVDLIPKVYNKERVIRIVGEDEKPQTVQINKPFVDEKGVERIYRLDTGKYDVTVSTGASYTTQREEARESLTELVRAYPPAAPIVGDLLVKMMDFPDSDKVSDRLKLLLPPQVQQAENDAQIPPEAQAMVMQLSGQLKQMQEQMQAGMNEFNKMKQENQKLKSQHEIDRVTIEKMQALKEIDKAVKRPEMMVQMPMQMPQQAQPSRRRMQIVAPSGAVYEGVIEDEVPEEVNLEE